MATTTPLDTSTNNPSKALSPASETKQNHEKGLVFTQKENRPYGFNVVDDLLAALLDAIEQKKLDRVLELREKGKGLLKIAFQQNNVALYTYILQHLYRICLLAFKNQDLPIIQSLLDLNHKEAMFVFDLLQKQDHTGFAFFLISMDDLEKFSEELDKNKNTILSFKKAVIGNLQFYGIKCIPSEIPKDFTLDQNFERDAFEKYCNALIEYYFMKGLPLEYAKLITKKIKILQADEFKSFLENFAFKFNTDFETMNVLELFFKSEGAPLLCWYTATFKLSQIALSHNVDPKELAHFKAKTYQALESAFGKPLLRNPDHIIKLLREAVHNKNKEETILLIFEFLAHIVNEFQKAENESPEKVGKLFLMLSENMSNLGENLTKLFTNNLAEFAPLGLKSDNLVQQQDMLSRLYEALSLSFFQDLGRACNVPENECALFARGVFEAIAKLSKTPSLFHCDETFSKNIKSLSKEDPQYSQRLKEIFSEINKRLKLAFEHKNIELYSHMIKQLIILCEHAEAQGKRKELLAVLNIKLPFIPKFSQALSLRDPKMLAKFFIDYTLKELIFAHDFECFNLKHRFKTNERFQKEIRDRDKAQILFQKNLYTHFGIPSSSENLGTIIRIPYSPYEFTDPEVLERIRNFGKEPKKEPSLELKEVLEKLKTAVQKKELSELEKEAINLKKLFKKSLNDFNTKECLQILTNTMEIIQLAHKSNAPEKIAEILDILMSPVHNNNYNRDVPRMTQTSFQAFLKFLDQKNTQACFFILFASINWQSYLGYEQEKLNKFLDFKKTLLEKLCPNLILYSPEEIGKILKAYQEAVLSQKPALQNKELLCHLDLYTKSLILKSQVPGRRAREAHEALGNLVLFRVRLMLDLGKSKRTPCLYDFLRLSSHQNKVLINLIMGDLPEKEKIPLLAWVFINLSDQTFFLREMPISPEAYYQVKTSIYQCVCSSFGIKELLRTPKAILEELQALGSLPSQTQAQIQRLSFEFRILLMESFQAREIQDFSEILSTTLNFFMTQIKNPRFIALFFNFKGGKLGKFINLSKRGEKGLALRFILEHLQIEKWMGQHFLSTEEARQFLDKFFLHFELEQKPLLKQNPDELLKGNLDQVANFDHRDPKFGLMTLELHYLLKDAFLSQKPEAFAHLLSIIQKFMKHLHQSGNYRALIHLFELRASNYEPPVQADFLEKLKKQNNLILEDLFQFLEANDADAVLQFLFDFYTRKFSQSSSLANLIDIAKFEKDVNTVLNINPLNHYNLDNIDFEKNSWSIVEQIRNMANQGVDLKLFEENFNRLAKSKSIMAFLPFHEKEDSEAYKAIFKRMQQIWIEHLVAHYFGVLGRGLEGSYSTTMAAELQNSCIAFSNTKLFPKCLAEAQALLKGLDEKEKAEMAANMARDTRDIFLSEDSDKLLEKLSQKQLVAIPLFLRSSSSSPWAWGHLTAAVFFFHRDSAYCILSDRGGLLISEKNSGLLVYKIGKPENIYTAASVLLCSNSKRLTVKQVRELLKPLDLKFCYVKRKKMQKSGTCAWASSAKMIDFSIDFVNCLQAIANLNPKTEENDVKLQAEFQLAEAAASPIYKGHSAFGREHILHRYFSACVTYGFRPNAHLLAQILIKSEKRPHRQRVVELIKEANIVKEEHRAQAFKTMLKTAESMILRETGLDDQTQLYVMDGKLISEEAQTLLNAYLDHQPEARLHKIIAEAVLKLKQRHPDLYKVKEKPEAPAQALILSTPRAEAATQALAGSRPKAPRV